MPVPVVVCVPSLTYSFVSILVKASADDDVPTVLCPSGDHVLEAITVDETISLRESLGRHVQPRPLRRNLPAKGHNNNLEAGVKRRCIPIRGEDYFLGGHVAPRGGNLPTAVIRLRHRRSGRVGVNLKPTGQAEFQNTGGEAVRINTAGGIPQGAAQAAVQVATKVLLPGLTSVDEDELGGLITRHGGLHGGDGSLCHIPLVLVVKDVEGVAGSRVADDVMGGREGVDGLDVGKLEAGDLHGRFGAER
ncbi:hypothetical protein PspLS_03896 [Pyricularia sp. CBS 133598]|nr:hypothetical protein PspLS_03896 [Pyricularia sp. CBS 133598]